MLTCDMQDDDFLWKCLKVLPSDYSMYGGTIERWQDGKPYHDCSWGCKWWKPLQEFPQDWGVCCNASGPRAGLLTWEHQAGYNCFESEKD